jgi:hypothetical protein
MDLSLDTCEISNINILTRTKDFIVSEDIAKLSVLLKTCIDNDKTCNELKLDIDSGIFEYIVEYLELVGKNKPSEIPKPIKDLSLRSYLQDWEYDYILKLESERMIKKVLDMTNYLDIPSLFELLCSKVASVIKHKIHLPNLNDIINNL